ncbi:protease SohB [Facilibium subflavum]|uniref:protease SohB n=1 Tax=Facilibium subflavum TaxID=2219058 RepID=UPI000E64D4B7|nr:protease SohB [Facilibium subflavum]
MWYESAIHYLFFVLEVATIAVAVVLAFGAIIGASIKAKGLKKGRLQVTPLNKTYQKNQHEIAKEALSKSAMKKLDKQHQLQAKALTKDKEAHKRLFVIDFHGDMKASQVEALSQEVDAILSIADKNKDSVLVRLESPGGVVNGYGLAAAQLARIRHANIHLTVAVDQVAASGGYMMASVADKIIASPFAIIGSIGVIAQLPNLHRFLTDKGVDVELHTAGKYKRTLTMLGENTDEGRQKFKQELEVVHKLFKTHITTYRPKLDIESVATGEYWFGTTALSLNLVDELMTSHAYLLDQYQQEKCKLLHVKYHMKKSRFASVYHSAVKQLTKVGP